MKQLTWKVDKTIPTACPDYKPDPYTGEYPISCCAVYHCKDVTEFKTAEFVTLKEAKEFVNKAPLNCYDFAINGKFIKDGRIRVEIKSPTHIWSLTGSDGITVANGVVTSLDSDKDLSTKYFNSF